uniref:Cytochrome c nitrite reductase small subunit n=1 Tax=Thermodesulfobacterium geofontis TaxID=1295609 RepID=A0A7C4JQ74_9BACT
MTVKIWFKKYGIYGIAVLFILLISVLLSSKIIAKTNTPEYCASCHVMQEEYLSLIKGGLHNSLKCVDCHLPNDSKVNFYFWKTVEGGKELIIFYSGRVSDPIKASTHAKKIIQQNCIRCHEGMVSRITISDRKCWDCHRRISHKHAGLRETI